MNATENKQAVLVWDFPVRVFHWLLVVSFAGAWLTSESEAQQMLHYAFGYSAVALVVFRLVWGLVGTRYARFSQFMKSPAETIRHFKSLPDWHRAVVGMGRVFLLDRQWGFASIDPITHPLD